MSVAQYVDILMLSETKLDSTFPSIQFLINGFSVPHRLDRNSKGGGILLYVRDKIIVLPLNRYSLPPHIEILFFELNLRNRKWLACCSYNPHKNLIKTIYEYLQKVLSSIKCKHEEKKSRSEKKVSTKQLIEESDDDEVISNIRGNNYTEDLSEPDDEMETGSINDNFRNAFYFATRINLHTFLAEQVASILIMS